MYFQIIESLWKALLVYQMESESKSYTHQLSCLSSSAWY